jgi:hypothetical protein
MNTGLNHACGSGTHPHAQRGADMYETPPVAVEALLRAEKLPHVVWEPAAGRGAIVNVLRAAGHSVIASDLIDYGVAAIQGGRDFLKETAAPAGCDTIITNPPFRIAQDFVEHALDLVPSVILLLRLAFLESERRSGILDGGKLARVHVFKNRLPMMHRSGWQGPRASSAIAFGWFIWSRAHSGPATIDRVSWAASRVGEAMKGAEE